MRVIPTCPALRLIRRRQAIALRKVRALARKHQVADRVVAGQAPGQHMVDLGRAFRDAHARIEAAAALQHQERPHHRAEADPIDPEEVLAQRVAPTDLGIALLDPRRPPCLDRVGEQTVEAAQSVGTAGTQLQFLTADRHSVEEGRGPRLQPA